MKRNGTYMALTLMVVLALFVSGCGQKTEQP